MLHVNNSLSGRVCCFFLASRLTIVSLDSYGIQEIHTSCNFIRIVAYICALQFLVQCYGVHINVRSGCHKAFARLISAYCKHIHTCVLHIQWSYKLPIQQLYIILCNYMYVPCISYEIARSVKTPVIHYTYICIRTHATTYMCVYV